MWFDVSECTQLSPAKQEQGGLVGWWWFFLFLSRSPLLLAQWTHKPQKFRLVRVADALSAQAHAHHTRHKTLGNSSEHQLYPSTPMGLISNRSHQLGQPNSHLHFCACSCLQEGSRPSRMPAHQGKLHQVAFQWFRETTGMLQVQAAARQHKSVTASLSGARLLNELHLEASVTKGTTATGT